MGLNQLTDVQKGLRSINSDNLILFEDAVDSFFKPLANSGK